MTRCLLISVVVAIAIVGCADRDDSESNVYGVEHLSALDQVFVAFEGSHSRVAIKARLDRAMQLYGVPLTEENYSRAGSALVALRQENGVPEMDVLDYMIRSHVEGVQVDFPSAAALASTFMATGAD